MNGVNILEGKTLKDQLQTIKSVRERLAKVLKGVFFQTRNTRGERVSVST